MEALGVRVSAAAPTRAGAAPPPRRAAADSARAASRSRRRFTHGTARSTAARSAPASAEDAHSNGAVSCGTGRPGSTQATTGTSGQPSAERVEDARRRPDADDQRRPGRPACRSSSSGASQPRRPRARPEPVARRARRDRGAALRHPELERRRSRRRRGGGRGRSVEQRLRQLGGEDEARRATQGGALQIRRHPDRELGRRGAPPERRRPAGPSPPPAPRRPRPPLPSRRHRSARSPAPTPTPGAPRPARLTASTLVRSGNPGRCSSLGPCARTTSAGAPRRTRWGLPMLTAVPGQSTPGTGAATNGPPPGRARQVRRVQPRWAELDLHLRPPRRLRARSRREHARAGLHLHARRGRARGPGGAWPRSAARCRTSRRCFRRRCAPPSAPRPGSRAGAPAPRPRPRRGGGRRSPATPTATRPRPMRGGRAPRSRCPAPRT